MQARSNCLWALAVLQGLTLPAFPVLVKAMVSSMEDWHDLEPVQRHQLFQVGRSTLQANILLLKPQLFSLLALAPFVQSIIRSNRRCKKCSVSTSHLFWGKGHRDLVRHKSRSLACSLGIIRAY